MDDTPGTRFKKRGFGRHRSHAFFARALNGFGSHRSHAFFARFKARAPVARTVARPGHPWQGLWQGSRERERERSEGARERERDLIIPIM